MDARPVKFLQRAGEHSHEAILACSWPGFPIIFAFMIFLLSSRPESGPSFNMNRSLISLENCPVERALCFT